ncbi:MAG: flavin reductase family protein [Firmicutes bacterium]|nr:flavin reductase family protein [Bacillota bacterium]
MAKKVFNPGTILSPVPAVMVSCGSGEDANIITIAWIGIVNSDPPMTYISVRKERHSYDIIKNSGEFVINLVNENLTFAADWCGVKSGRDFDKWKEQKLTKAEASVVKCPIIKESPLSLECKVKDIIELGSHDMFLAEIVSISADESIVDEKNAIRLDRAKLVAYNHGHYFPLKRTEIGRFGYSVMKPKTRKRYEAEKNAERRRYSRNKNKR